MALLPSLLRIPLVSTTLSFALRTARAAVVPFLRLLGAPSLPSSVRHLWVRDVFGASQEVLVAAEVALQCGANMRRCHGVKASGVAWKGGGSSIDPVTETDEENERFVQRAIARAFPTHEVIGEEAATAAGTIPHITDVPTWIVDPIDGTANFVHGNPLCCVSIGHCVGQQPRMGVVYDPYLDELYVAVRGAGAYCNGLRIGVDPAEPGLEKALILNEPGYERSPAGVAKILAVMKALLDRNVQAMRVTGSAVLSIVWVACGRANAYYAGLHEKDCPKPWDWCAGYVIGLEAGATFSRCDARSYPGGPVLAPGAAEEGTFDIFSKSCIVASSQQLCAEVRQIVLDCTGSK